MSDKFKSTFEKIHAEDQLKEETLRRIREQNSKKKSFRERFKIKRVATVLACFVSLFLIGIFSYNTYFTESAYVDLDINPSIELSINRFDRVIEANAYNKDGQDLLADLHIKNEKINAALSTIIKATAEEGQLQKEGIVSVTVQSDNSKEEELLDDIKSVLQTTLSEYDDTETDIFTVDEKTKTASHDEHLSPAKYLAILALQEVDPTATISECRHHSIGNIKKQTREHSRNHGGKSHDRVDDDSEDAHNGNGGNNSSHNKSNNNSSNSNSNNNNNNNSNGDGRHRENKGSGGNGNHGEQHK